MKFYRIMLPCFMTQLFLPLRFCESAMEEYSSNAEIRTCLGSWKIRVGKLRSDGIRFYFHGIGWARFVENHGLHHCDFVVFDHLGSFHFHATIYSPDCCLKNFSLNSQTNTNINGNHQTASLHQSTNLTFTRILSAYSGRDYHTKNNCRLHLPKQIWKDNVELLEKNRAILRISGLANKEWDATLKFYKGAASRLDAFGVFKGWYDFVCANDIKRGHYCEFEIVVDASPFGYSNKTVIIIVKKRSYSTLI